MVKILGMTVCTEQLCSLSRDIFSDLLHQSSIFTPFHDKSLQN